MVQVVMIVNETFTEQLVACVYREETVGLIVGVYDVKALPQVDAQRDDVSCHHRIAVFPEVAQISIGILWSLVLTKTCAFITSYTLSPGGR